MKSPYIDALNLPAAGDEAPFMKKDTVIGTIGNTHGVSRAANPHRIASMTSPQLNFPAAGPFSMVPWSDGAGMADSSPMLNFQYSGMLQ